MTAYLAFLRGVNVGGKALVKMADLKIALSQASLNNVRTYIQSGNVIFDSVETDTDKLAGIITTVILDTFGVETTAAVFSQEAWEHIIKDAPAWWGANKEWKHNILIMIGKHDMQQIMASIGELKPDIELFQPGKGVIYQSLSLKFFGRTTTGSKLVSNPIYKQMTIRNYNTAHKLADCSIPKITSAGG